MGRRLITVAALLLLLLGGAGVVYRALFQDPAQDVPTARPDLPAAPADAATPVAQAPGVVPDAGGGRVVTSGIRVLEATGPLERRTVSGDGGQWSPLEKGDTLQPADAVRTGRDGTALLQVGDGAKVRVAGRTELTLKAVAEDQVRVRLVEGRLAADVSPDGKGVFQVETQGSDAVVETRGGRFSMMSDGRGQVAVATETGQVRLRARGKDVTVAAGNLSTVSAGGAPSTPTAIPKSLLLKVAAPGKSVQRETEHDVEGTATPGAVVRVKDRVVKVDDQGRFRLKVPLREGDNTVEVSAVDVMGRERLSTYQVTVDTKAPAVKGSMKWGK
jgi:hypothetical protein